MIDIRIAKKSDAKVLALLGRVTYTESHGRFIENKKDLLAYCVNVFSVEKISADLQDKNIFFYLVLIDKLPVGYAKIILNSRFEDKTESTSCRLERIYILNDFLSKKIGQPLLDFITEDAKKKNATNMWLSVYFKNKKAISFYNRNQFKNIGELNFFVNGKNYYNLVLSKKI